MQAFSTVLQVSIGGSVELLTLCAAGAALSHLGHWNGKISAAMSNGVYKIFFPALVFVAMLSTVQNALKHSADAEALGSAQELWVPLCFSVIISLAMIIVAYPLTILLARNKSECTRRAIFMCIVLGNSNSMPLLIMQSLCDGYQPLSSNEQCFMKATAYGTLYISFVTFLGFSLIFPYVLSAAQDQNQEEAPLLGEVCSAPLKRERPHLRAMLRQSLLAPPTATIIATAILACIPGVADAFLAENGPLRSVMESSAMVGSIAVPLSSVIVGGDLYEALTCRKTNEHNRKRFGNFVIVAICMIRLVLFPFLGRWAYRAMGLKYFITENELGLFILMEFGVLTANNAMIIVNMLADTIPGQGDGMRRDVAKCLFAQYVIAPLLVTINTALAIKVQYE
eukprot:TRINITY_DN1711_c0_g1_i2.p1 TRINITY_DN1711_c0_g1~~TRINITY_DN1711_c0_g1_i2.p1  ORF type:complete len:396 (-),score=42.94 TRINITY_DN1711_c0_g1_i2:1184-2371(-)